MATSDDETPLISVLMTAYNREAYIAEAIESVICASAPALELIITDDGSKDRTVEIIKKYASADNRIRFFENERNLGDYPNRNKAASYARGKYIQYVDSDDMILNGGLTYTVGQMENNPDVDFAILCKEPAGLKNFFSSKEAVAQHFFKKPFLQIGPGGTIMKRSFFEKIGGYPTVYGPVNDNYFNLLAAASGKVMLLTEDFIFYRIHAGQEINNQRSYLYNGYRYQADAFRQLDLGLDQNQLRWLINKNKRRFLVNISRFLLQTRSVTNTASIWKLAGFRFTDVFPALFQVQERPKLKSLVF